MVVSLLSSWINKIKQQISKVFHQYRCCRDHMVVGFTTTFVIGPITTEVVSSNPTQKRCTTLCDKFVSDLRQVGTFLRALCFLHQ